MLKFSLLNKFFIILFDPLEQFELTWVTNGLYLTNTTIAISGILVLSLLALLVRSLRSGILSLISHKLWNFFKSIYINILGYKHQEYALFFFFVFLFILASNLIGMIPFTYTITSYFLITFFLSFTVFFGIVLTGLQERKFGFLQVFSPQNVPKVIYMFLVSIEFISYFMRVISLATRLFANMVAGHALMKILISFLW
jgi:F-type H+-transporting ATPase subunit a